MNIPTKRSVAFGALALSMAAPAVAQNLRPEKTLYILPRIGITNYYGDYDQDLFDFNDWGQDTRFPTVPVGLSLELGYQFTPAIALGVSGQFGNFPTIYADQKANNNPNPDNEYTHRYTGAAVLRFTAGARSSRVAPYLELGGAVVAGNSITPNATDDEQYGYGPRVGLGLDIVLSRRTSLFFGLASDFIVSDDNAVDGSDRPSANPAEITPSDSPEFDVLSALSLGLKVNFKPAFSPVDVIAIDGPAALQTGQTGNYSATTNDGMATMPVSYMWDFGDGSTAEGLSAAHAYNAAGVYNVTFTASNSGSTDSATMTTTVTNPPVPAEILSNTATPATQCVNQAVRFSATGRGDAPVSYTWNFGDGTTGTGMTPTHTYTRPGTYTVSVTGSNASGSNSRSTTVTINDCTTTSGTGVSGEGQTGQNNCALSISELNSTYFDRNSSVITEQGRMRLMENVDVMRRCLPLRANIVGYASRGEVNPQGLSEARARSVMQFYVDNGVDASRLSMEGRGMMGGSKKDDVNQYRRADTLPVR